jgi:hypothetical protein
LKENKNQEAKSRIKIKNGQGLFVGRHILIYDEDGASKSLEMLRCRISKY